MNGISLLEWILMALAVIVYLVFACSFMAIVYSEIDKIKNLESRRNKKK